MHDKHRKSGTFFKWRIATLAAVSAGAVLCIYAAGGNGWWWEGFWLVSVGMLLGQSAGIAVDAYFRGGRNCESDAPLVLGNAAGVGAMVAVWLCLPEGVVTILGHVARVIDGAAVGCLLVLINMPYSPKGKLNRG